MSQLLLVIIVVAFGAFCFGGGYLARPHREAQSVA
jgi:uncharacterized protein YneF (UPF0154 family)